MSLYEQLWAIAKSECSNFASENETQSLFDLLPLTFFFLTDTAKLMSLRRIANNITAIKKIFKLLDNYW